VEEVTVLKRQGLSIRAISRITGYDHKMIGSYLATPSRRLERRGAFAGAARAQLPQRTPEAEMPPLQTGVLEEELGSKISQGTTHLNAQRPRDSDVPGPLLFSI
jgi:hypothetical protein